MKNKECGCYILSLLKEFRPRNSKVCSIVPKLCTHAIRSTQLALKSKGLFYNEFNSKKKLMASSLLLANPIQASTHSI